MGERLTDAIKRSEIAHQLKRMISYERAEEIRSQVKKIDTDMDNYNSPPKPAPPQTGVEGAGFSSHPVAVPVLDQKYFPP